MAALEFAKILPRPSEASLFVRAYSPKIRAYSLIASGISFVEYALFKESLFEYALSIVWLIELIHQKPSLFACVFGDSSC